MVFADLGRRWARGAAAGFAAVRFDVLIGPVVRDASSSIRKVKQRRSPRNTVVVHDQNKAASTSHIN